ncbi:MAG: hypothetical protein ACYTX0_62770, partial [Nostoc sp.]
PATVPTVEPEATTTMIHPVIEPKAKLEVVTLPTAEPELLATFAPELVSPMPKEAMATPAAGIATSAAFLAPVQALEVLTIRELKRMASAS